MVDRTVPNDESFIGSRTAKSQTMDTFKAVKEYSTSPNVSQECVESLDNESMHYMGAMTRNDDYDFFMTTPKRPSPLTMKDDTMKKIIVQPFKRMNSTQDYLLKRVSISMIHN
jgi:hypothetical protein